MDVHKRTQSGVVPAPRDMLHIDGATCDVLHAQVFSMWCVPLDLSSIQVIFPCLIGFELFGVVAFFIVGRSERSS